MNQKRMRAMKAREYSAHSLSKINGKVNSEELGFITAKNKADALLKFKQKFPNRNHYHVTYHSN